jgi:hypothetical protein
MTAGPRDNGPVPPTDAPWGVWDPASVPEVAARFAAITPPWWVAGGYALELAAGRRWREHGDIDVLLLRRDQLAAQQALAGWQWWAAEPSGTLRRWLAGQLLPADVHDIWCRPGDDEPWRIQVMLDESDGADWVSRRDRRIRRPIASLGCVSPGGIPYLCPEIQLFYKAKRPRPKDEADFTAVLPLLTGDQRRWLHDAIVQAYGRHPWQTRLAPGPPAPGPPARSGPAPSAGEAIASES